MKTTSVKTISTKTTSMETTSVKTTPMKTTALWTGWLLALAFSATSISATAAQGVRYVHTDHLGTPIAWTDESGNIIKTSEYEPYGALLNRPMENGPGYTGHVEDAATGLTYMQQRYYDSGIGMFLSVDPVTAHSNPVGQFNRYRYANGNPYRYTDPDGENPFNFNYMPDQNANAAALIAETRGLAQQENSSRIEDAASYPARQIVGNAIAGGASAASLFPMAAPVAGPIAAVASIAVTADKAAHEGLDSNDTLGAAVSIIPAAGAMKAVGATEAIVTAVKVDAALIGVTTGAASAAAANENASTNMNEQMEKAEAIEVIDGLQ